MGWFEEQVKQRKKLDEKTFEDSFASLAGIKVDKKSNLSDEAIKENFAISQVLSYFRHQMVDIPEKITTFKDKLNYALSQVDIEYRKVELNGEWVNDTHSPVLIFTLISQTPVVLFPIGNKAYYYINYQTGKKVKIEASLINKLEMEAYSFYRPLPSKKISVKEYAKYLQKNIRVRDIVLLILTSAIVSGVGLLIPYLTRILTGDVIDKGNINYFIITSIYVVSAAAGLVLIKAIEGYVNSRITISVNKGVTEATMMKALNLPTSFFKKYNTGELTARFQSVIGLANLIVSSLFVTLISVVMSLMYLFQLIGFAPSLILPVIIVLFVSSAFSILIAYIQRNYSKKQLELSSKENGLTYEIINGIQKIRLSGSEKRVFAKWAKAYSKSARLLYNPPLLLKIAPAISLLITLLGNIAIYAVAAKNNISVSSYMAFVSSYGVLSSAFASLSQMVGLVYSIQPMYEMARPFLEAEPENNSKKPPIENIKGNIKFENVSFRYNSEGPLVVNNLSLDIKEGEYIAIVGQTGCGKSTLVRLLLGFEEPINGNILIDGNNLKNVDLTSLRRNIGTVMQNGTLFHADILSNIIISSPSLKEEDAWEAAEIANIADDIREMPMGMNTVISEGQGGISGGQKQRIMIARAIVHKPKVLIFDEATSALDNKTQKSISDSISKLNCTRIVIAHRLSTIQSADRILMLEGGKVIEEGNYQTLIDKKGKFAELVDRQRLDNNK